MPTSEDEAFRDVMDRLANAPLPLDVLVEISGIPHKAELVARVKAAAEKRLLEAAKAEIECMSPNPSIFRTRRRQRPLTAYRAGDMARRAKDVRFRIPFIGRIKDQGATHG